MYPAPRSNFWSMVFIGIAVLLMILGLFMFIVPAEWGVVQPAENKDLAGIVIFLVGLSILIRQLADRYKGAISQAITDRIFNRPA